MMNTRQRTALAMLAGLVLATGTACAADVGGVTDTDPPPLTTPTPSPEPTQTTAAPDPEDPATWVISENGVGPIEIGGDLAGTLAKLPDTWTNDAENCAWTAWLKDSSVDYGVYFVRGTESDSAPISEISVYEQMQGEGATGAPATAEGLTLGATRDEILAAYPNAQEGKPQIGDGIWIMVPGDAAAHIFFEFREGSDTAWDITVTTRSEPSYEVCG